MKQFNSIEKIDTAILYALELTSSISVLLLAFGLIASMANVLTKGPMLTDDLLMQRVWAWTQFIAIDASVAGTIIRAFRYHAEGECVKTWLYGLLSALLLFTVAILSNIESIQQTLNITLDWAYVRVWQGFLPGTAISAAQMLYAYIASITFRKCICSSYRKVDSNLSIPSEKAKSFYDANRMNQCYNALQRSV